MEDCLSHEYILYKDNLVAIYCCSTSDTCSGKPVVPLVTIIFESVWTCMTAMQEIILTWTHDGTIESVGFLLVDWLKTEVSDQFCQQDLHFRQPEGSFVDSVSMLASRA